jgi:hypothetical protein
LREKRIEQRGVWIVALSSGRRLLRKGQYTEDRGSVRFTLPVADATRNKDACSAECRADTRSEAQQRIFQALAVQAGFVDRIEEEPRHLVTGFPAV